MVIVACETCGGSVRVLTPRVVKSCIACGTPSRVVAVVRPSGWPELHSYPVEHAKYWQPAEARRWYRQWCRGIPTYGCECEANWEKYTADNPPQFDSAWGFFRWSVEAHNYVSENHATPRKPAMSLVDATLTYCPKPQDYWSGRMVAVTSLSPNPSAGDRQQRALRSWREFGLRILAVNSAAEVDQLQSRFPDVDRWIVREPVATDYDRPTQRIKTLAMVAIELNQPILIINSDIEIYGHPRTLEDVPEDALVVGIRHNYQVDRHAAKRELWGLDAFRITQAMAATLPDLPLGIGRPVWDYWLPHHFRELGFAMHFIGSPYFFHCDHDRQWSAAEWRYGAEILRGHYDVELNEESPKFRNSLPFPPDGRF